MTIHWCGTGLSSIPGLRKLILDGYDVVVWNRTLENAKLAFGDLTNNLRAFNSADIENTVKPGDVIVSMLPGEFHVQIAELAIAKKANFVSSSYISPQMRHLNDKAKDCGADFVKFQIYETTNMVTKNWCFDFY